MRPTFVLCILAFAFMFAAIPALVQDPVKVAPHAFKVLLNDSEVRVLEYSSKPGQKEAMHSHPAILLYVIQGGKLKSTTPDGTSKEIEYKTDDIQWREAIAHTGEIVGTTEMKSLFIEVKHGKKKYERRFKPIGLNHPVLSPGRPVYICTAISRNAPMFGAFVRQ